MVLMARVAPSLPSLLMTFTFFDYEVQYSRKEWFMKTRSLSINLEVRKLRLTTILLVE